MTRPYLLLATCLVALAAIGCRHRQPTTETVTVVDGLGRSVAVPVPVRRVVSLAPNLTEIVFAAGGGSDLVGVTTADDYPPTVRSLPQIDALPLDFESLVATEPDLVLATDQVNNPGDADTFDALDVPVYFFSFQGLDSILDGIRTTGRLLGTQDTADAAADSLAQRVADLRARTDSVTDRPRTLVLVGPETLYSFGRGSYVQALVDLAGGRSITGDVESDAPVLSDEFVLSSRPEVIIGAWGDAVDRARLLDLHPTWDVVPAVRNGRVYGVDPDLILRPGPRLVEGAYRMAAFLHPSLFDPTADGEGA